MCKLKLYGDDSSQFQSSTRDLGDVTGFEGHSGVGMCQGGKHDTSEFQLSSICTKFISAFYKYLYVSTMLNCQEGIFVI